MSETEREKGERMLNWTKWGYGLASGTITGVASSGLAALGVAGANATGLVSTPDLNMKQLGIIAISGGIVGAFSYLKQSPLPPENANGDTKTVDSAAPTKIIGLLLFSCAVMFGFNGCTTLAPDGPYKGDMVTYQADLLIPMFPEVTSTFLKWEQANRVNLKKWPEIKKAADYIRANGKEWTKTAIAMRESYSLNPTEDNRTALVKALSVLRTGLTESTKYLDYGPNNNN